MVALQLWIRAGSADEQPGEEGACHLLEHLLFRGAEGQTSPLAAGIEAVGGEVNAFTSCDHTVFFATVPAPSWAGALQGLCRAVFSPSIDPRVLETEQRVVLEEIEQVHDDPTEVLGAAVRSACYGEHPYARPITGTAAQVSRLTLQGILGLHGRAFTPANAALICAGPVDEGAVRSALDGLLPPGPPALDAGRPAVLWGPGSVVTEQAPGATTARFEVSWAGPSACDPDRPALDLLAWVLAGRVAAEDDEGEPLETEVWAPRQPGLVTAWAAARPGQVLADLATVVRAAEGLRRHALSPSELRDAQTALAAQSAFGGEAVEHRADRMGQGLVDAGDLDAHLRWLEGLRSLKPEPLRRVAHRWLAPERRTVGVVSPEPISASEVRGALRRAGRRTARTSGRQLRTRGRGAVASVARAQAGEVRVEATDGGSVLVGESRPGSRVASLHVGFRGGRALEPADAAGRLDLLTEVWLGRTPRRDAAALESTLDRLGATLEPWVDLDAVGWRLDFLAEHAGRALDLCAEMLLCPRFGRRTLEEARRAARSSQAGRRSDGATQAAEAARARLWPDHPWGSRPWGRREDLPRWNAASLTEAWHRHARADGAVLSLSGDLDLDAALPRLGALAEALPRTERPEPPPLPASVPGRVETRLPRARGHLVVVWPGLAASDPDLPAAEVLTTLLGAQSGPVFAAVRERHGLAYDVDVSHLEGRLGGALELRVATDPDRLETVRGVVDQTLEALSDALQDDALRSAARLAAGRRRLDRQSSSVRAEDRALAAAQGLDALTPDRLAIALEGVEPQDVRRVAARIIAPGRAIESIVRPEREGASA